MRVLLRPQVTGRERLPASGPVLFVSNHEAWWDIPLIGYASPRPVRFMAKSELFRNRAIGGFLRKGGAFPVRRGEPDRDVFRTVHDAFTDGDIVGVFLQGHRQAELADAKAGAGRIAIVESAPVVPLPSEAPGSGAWAAAVQIVFGEPRSVREGRAPPGRGLPGDRRRAAGADPPAAGRWLVSDEPETPTAEPRVAGAGGDGRRRRLPQCREVDADQPADLVAEGGGA